MGYVRKVAPSLLALIATGGLAACGSGGTGNEESTGGGATGSSAASAGRATATATQTIVVRNAEPVGGVQRLEYSAGDRVEFTVGSDVADEIHVHGYDIMKDIPAGGSVSLSFPAELEGIFEVELEEHATQIAELRVNP